LRSRNNFEFAKDVHNILNEYSADLQKKEAEAPKPEAPKKPGSASKKKEPEAAPVVINEVCLCYYVVCDVPFLT